MAILWVYYGYYILLTHNYLVQCYTMVTKVSLVSKLKSVETQEGSVKYQQQMTDEQCSKDYYKLDKKL